MRIGFAITSGDDADGAGVHVGVEVAKTVAEDTVDVGSVPFPFLLMNWWNDCRGRRRF